MVAAALESALSPGHDFGTISARLLLFRAEKDGVGRRLRYGGVAAIAALCCLLLLSLDTNSSAKPPRHRPLILGANTTAFTEDPGAALDAFASRAKAMPRIVMYFQDWNEGWKTALLDPRYTKPILARHAAPMITWMPMLGGGDPLNQPDFAPARIAAGAFDGYIERAAKEAVKFKRPFFIRLAHEMNGTWSPWGAVNGNTPADYVAMWRHVVSIFRQEGADNVRWVWSPNVYGVNSVAPFQAYYPGNRWVDFVGLDGYNFGAVPGSLWISFGDLFWTSYLAATALTHKPLMITETASSPVGGDKARWIGNLRGILRTRMPRVRALIWFDRIKEQDWRFDSSPESRRAFRRLVRPPLFGGKLKRLLERPRRHRR
jgi:hypothetical protein